MFVPVIFSFIESKLKLFPVSESPLLIIIIPSISTIIAESFNIFLVVLWLIIVAKLPNPNIIGSVPRPKTARLVEPLIKLPVPAAYKYIACNGPQAINNPFNNPVINGPLYGPFAFCPAFSVNFVRNLGLNWNFLKNFIPNIDNA